MNKDGHTITFDLSERGACIECKYAIIGKCCLICAKLNKELSAFEIEFINTCQFFHGGLPISKKQARTFGFIFNGHYYKRQNKFGLIWTRILNFVNS